MKGYVEMQRQKTWELKECQDSYQELIDSVESEEIQVSERMKVIAKEIAITSYLNNLEPNLENFKNRVVRENRVMNHNY
ncbi:TPA: hypothetical protein DD450_04370 [Candidatus Woesebacteria bacterium]|nr:hypothetical protein [Candidatus Woesebacteria bacterium]